MVLEQAKGVLAQHGDIAVDEAFGALRGYARSRNLRLHESAARLVAGSLSARKVLGAG